MNDCSKCVVRNSAICSSLDAEEILALGQLSREQNVVSGQSLLWEGDDSLVVANVIEGVFKLSVNSADGREQIVGIVFPSDFVGRPFGDESPYSVTAMTPGKVCMFTRKAFDNFARQHPELEHKLLHRTLNELDNARKWMQLLGRKTAEEKIATFLLFMSDRLNIDSIMGCKNKDGEIINALNHNESQFIMPFGRQQIADVLGLTIETVSRQLTKMKKANLISLPSRRDIILHDLAALKIMSDA